MIASVLAAALAFAPADAHLAYETAAALVRDCTPRDSGTPGALKAAKAICAAAKSRGANARIDSFTGKTNYGSCEFHNVEAEFVANANDPWIVMLSHFDTKPGVKCPGANDGAATSGLLVGFAQALARTPLAKGNVLLVWTDGEESRVKYGENDGLWGSRHAARRLAESGRKVEAVICADMIGDRDLAITIPANGDQTLTGVALAAAKAADVQIKTTEFHVIDDHVPFLVAGFPAIDLIDFEYGPGNAWWHAPEDTMDKVSEESLLASGRMLAAMVNEIFSSRKETVK